MDFVGTIRESRLFGKYIVEKITRQEKAPHYRKYYWIRFIDTGFAYEVVRNAVRDNQVKDYYKPNVYGVGFLGDMYIKVDPKISNLWRGVLGRCYSKTNASYKNYGEKGVTVCSRWHNYTNFHNDILQLEGYDEELFTKGELQLDKDIKHITGNKIYSPETCMFVSKSRNVEEIESTRDYRAISPNGSMYEGRNIKKFCEEHNLSYVQVYALFNNEGQYRHKGWVFGNIEESYESLREKQAHGLKRFFAFNTETDEVYDVIGAKQFAIKHNLSEGNISSCLSGKRDETKGWRFFLSKEELEDYRKGISNYP